MIDPVVARISIAALSGLAVGFEREWSGHASGPLARFAGLRTFLLLGILGGAAGWMAETGSQLIAAVLVAGAAALAVAAYVAASRAGGRAIDGTTEVAALVVVALGVLAGLGFLELSSGATAVIVLALSEKDRLRTVVARIGSDELHAALQFAVLALVVLPLLPDGTYGPLGGIRPRSLWTVVLVFTGLNFIGYLARRAVGVERGYGVTGMLGGLISSTVVTFQFSRLSRQDPGMGSGLAIGVVGATTVLIPRLLVVSTVLNASVAFALLPLLLPPLLLGIGLGIFAFYRRWEPPEPRPPEHEVRSPLRLWSAIQMAAAFQVTLMAISLVREYMGSSGVLASAALLGFTDMDALTLSMNRLGESADLVQLAARAIAIGVISNGVLKFALALTMGTQEYRRLATIGLALMTLASAGALWLFW